MPTKEELEKAYQESEESYMQTFENDLRTVKHYGGSDALHDSIRFQFRDRCYRHERHQLELRLLDDPRPNEMEMLRIAGRLDKIEKEREELFNRYH